ncbi:MAG: flavin reductase family protein [Dehalococcoidales bacterium]|jgi:flavin reductase (DIM6/NTAB) family NADH-FMN oxidoreductase RutF|nr:flavin reductase family protein [Dehalococcoidales bacterium]MDD3994596.1 flavin reductase family protein [Dehalococcoidales bacterium]NLT27906.1 flavin reductase family protein [Dehalococcoidales bacterium]
MDKKTFGPSAFVFPEPVFLVGVNVDGKPNFMTAAWGGMACGAPQMLTVAIRHQRYTMKGIKPGGSFSVNIPSEQLVEEADLCGIISGANADKVAACGFDVFYGKLENAPLIRQCPVNLECKIVHMLNLGSHTLVIGSIEETHVTEDCLTEGVPDVEKIKPILYSRGTTAKYYGYGKPVGDAFNIGNNINHQ